MIKKLKRKLNRINDHGSSFILVIVATTFMCILVSALLMGALMTYKLKFYKLNSLNNFYEVETALDEIYAGVGTATNEHLYSAYTTTAELVVVYDMKTKSYVNLTDEEANALFKKLFMSGFIADSKFKGIKEIKSTLESFISNQKGMILSDGSTNTDGVYLDTSNMVVVFTDANGKTRTESLDADGNMKRKIESSYNKENVVNIAFKNICVKRDVDVKGTSAGTYTQSITTDIMLAQPEYSVSFDMSNTTASSLYNYATISDMGLEINTGNDDDATDDSDSSSDDSKNTVHISGNIYAANDYYNKDYNADKTSQVTTWYTDNKALKWGTTDSSLYSGIYVSGNQTKVNLSSNVIICPGTLGAHNGADLVVSGRSNVRSELWADNIVLGGNKGGKLTMAADAYVYDDTELNASKASLTFTQGRYFGYSYNAADSRSIEYLKGTAGGEDNIRLLATGYKLRSHFSDSAIIVNGKDSTLDLSKLDSLYIAGKSYIEFSKITAKDAADGNKNVADADKIAIDDNAEYAYTNLTDYSTGQSLDVKSNQLIFLAQWSVADEVTDADGNTSIYMRLPEGYKGVSKFNDAYADFVKASGKEDAVRVIKQELSGHEYYYLYIDDDAIETDSSDGRSLAERFAEAYYDMLGTSTDFIDSNTYNVRNYENFKVKLILPSDNSTIKTSGALTDQGDSDDLNGNADKLFFRKSTDTTLDVKTALENVSDSKPFSELYMNNGGLFDNRKLYTDIESSARLLSGSASVSRDQRVSNLLSYMYINMKDHLAVVDRQDDKKQNINAWELANYTKNINGSNITYSYTYDEAADKYSYNYSMTPINQYVDMNAVLYDASHGITVNKTIGETDGVKDSIIINKGSVTVDTDDANGRAQGIIIAAGEVKFSNKVKSFTGLIISGSKIKIDHVMDITADANYVSTLLKKCSKSTDEDISKLTGKVLKNYVNTEDEKKSDSSTISISDISYEDILTFQNWKRNVE